MNIQTAISTVAKATASNLNGLDGLVINEEITALDWIKAEIGEQVSCLGVSFENRAAYLNFERFVISEISKIDNKLYRTAFPEVQMDANGRYTSNPSRWA